MDTAPLRDFLIGVPSCVETDSLMPVWQVFQETGCLHIVVVDQQQVALGVLSLHHFIPYALKEKADSSGKQQSIRGLWQERSLRENPS